MKIFVLVKLVPDTYNKRELDLASGILKREAGELIIDEISERAIEVALRYKDSNKGTEIVLLSMGPEPITAILRKTLALNVDSAMHVLDDALTNSDASRTAAVLATVLDASDYDLIIAGNESTDGRGGVIPAMVSEHLRLPLLTNLDTVEISDGRVSGTRAVEAGSMDAHASLPAVISITERTPELRLPGFKGVLSAKKKPLSVLALEDLELTSDGLPANRSTILSTLERPERSAGTTITDEGDAGTRLAEFLASEHLI